ncbi:unnamed protein product [Gadus morhua 'NCC']
MSVFREAGEKARVDFLRANNAPPFLPVSMLRARSMPGKTNQDTHTHTVRATRTHRYNQPLANSLKPHV